MYRTISSLLEKSDCRYNPSGTTIGEIGALAAGIRDRFSERGAPADEPVCLCVEERSHLMAALLASMAGAPPFILPHTIHPQVLREVHAVRPFRLILADTAVEPPEGTAIIPIEECRPPHRLLKLVRPPDEAFLSLFTGGSTGKPRIWSKTPANLFGEALHLAKTFGIGGSDLILPTVPPQHIYGLLFSVLLPFVASARVLDRTCTFPQEILSALQNEGATVLVSVPIHYRAMRAGGIGRFSLRLALSSAAPLDGDDAAAFRQQTGLAINEIYGSTETGGMAIRSYGENHGSWEPFSCIDWKILSDHLCVRSAFVSPDLPRDAEGFFMTADRAAEAGETRFMLRGRADHVVKIAGKRVDLEEIREKIRRIPGVKDAYVTAAPLKRARQTEISALVVSDLQARDLRAAIRSMDESCGRPRRIRIVEAIPILPNGKIDRERVDRLLNALPVRKDQED
ncbi:MAG: class I adenylate-forming enzyme family protein [Syntrophales bacterium]